MYKIVISALVSFFLAFSPQSEARSERGAQAGKTKKSAISKSRLKRQALSVRHKAAPRGTLVRRTVMVNGKRKTLYQRVFPAVVHERAVPSAGDLAGLRHTSDPLDLASSVALIVDQNSSEVLFEKNAGVALPIASITKLMTGLIVVEANQDMNEILTVTDDDVDREKFSSSRLRVGSQMSRGSLLHIALMSSENRAAAALGRNYPGGLAGFVAAMNAKAIELGMKDTRYVDSSGLSSRNVASARDLAKLAVAAYGQPLLRQYSTDPKSIVDAGGRMMHYNNTNYLVAMPDWNVGLQKTGYIREAGRCLVMQTIIDGRSVIMVFLDSKGKQSRTADAGRVRRWLEAIKPPGIG